MITKINDNSFLLMIRVKLYNTLSKNNSMFINQINILQVIQFGIFKCAVQTERS